MEQLLDTVLELVRPLLPQILEPGAVMGEGRSLQRFREALVVDAVELELEEDQPGGELVEPLIDVAIELLAGRVGGVADIIEAGVRADAAKEVGERLIIGDGGGKLGAGEVGQPALPFLCE
jgi:hypothetical protein